MTQNTEKHAMEPERKTEASLLPVLEELKSREPIFHCPEQGTTRADFEQMIAPDFWETGASGRRYSREYVLEVLEERSSAPHTADWRTSDFYCQRLAEDQYLLTYTLMQADRRTRRSTIWRLTSFGWQIVFHQGTVVQE